MPVNQTQLAGDVDRAASLPPQQFQSRGRAGQRFGTVQGFDQRSQEAAVRSRNVERRNGRDVSRSSSHERVRQAVDRHGDSRVKAAHKVRLQFRHRIGSSPDRRLARSHHNNQIGSEHANPAPQVDRFCAASVAVSRPVGRVANSGLIAFRIAISESLHQSVGIRQRNDAKRDPLSCVAEASAGMKLSPRSETLLNGGRMALKARHNQDSTPIAVECQHLRPQQHWHRSLMTRHSACRANAPRNSIGTLGNPLLRDSVGNGSRVGISKRVRVVPVERLDPNDQQQQRQSGTM